MWAWFLSLITKESKAGLVYSLTPSWSLPFLRNIYICLPDNKMLHSCNMYLYMEFKHVHKTAFSGFRCKISPEKEIWQFYRIWSWSLYIQQLFTRETICIQALILQLIHSSYTVLLWFQHHLPSQRHSCEYPVRRQTVQRMGLTFSEFLSSISQSLIVTWATLLIFHWTNSGS